MANPGKGKEEKKVKRPTEQKRQIQNEKRRVMNKGSRSRVRTGIKSYLDALKGQDMAKKEASLNELFSLVDKAAKKGVFKLNKASRIKSRMASKLQKGLVG